MRFKVYDGSIFNEDCCRTRHHFESKASASALIRFAIPRAVVSGKCSGRASNPCLLPFPPSGYQNRKGCLFKVHILLFTLVLGDSILTLYFPQLFFPRFNIFRRLKRHVQWREGTHGNIKMSCWFLFSSRVIFFKSLFHIAYYYDFSLNLT